MGGYREHALYGAWYKVDVQQTLLPGALTSVSPDAWYTSARLGPAGLPVLAGRGGPGPKMELHPLGLQAEATNPGCWCAFNKLGNFQNILSALLRAPQLSGNNPGDTRRSGDLAFPA